MYHSIQLTDSMNPVNGLLWQGSFRLLPLVLAFAWFGLSPTARAVTPPPDGGYSNQNTAEGENALFSLNDNSYGYNNTAIGFEALYNNTDGFGNTAIGAYALDANTTGIQNTATGVYALTSNTTGSSNLATGDYALFLNTTGNNNTATGASALFGNTTGNNNTSDGFLTLTNNSTGKSNTAIGYTALYNNTTGFYNTANGANALYYNTTGIYNTATGYNALISNTAGYYNTATGLNSLFTNGTGNYNTADGLNALYFNTTGSNNIALGYSAGSNIKTGSNNIDIGNTALSSDSNTIRIGTSGTQQATYVTGISGKVVAGGVGVIIDSSGHLGTIVSSERFKDAIKPMDKASETIFALEPVTFRYKQALDPEGIQQFGLVAEQVAKVNPDLVARDKAGKPYTVRYEAVNAMLLNEFLKEHRKVEEQEGKLEEQTVRMQGQDRKVHELDATVAKLESAFKEQALQIQKVTDQMRVTNSAPRVVANNQ